MGDVVVADHTLAVLGSSAETMAYPGDVLAQLVVALVACSVHHGVAGACSAYCDFDAPVAVALVHEPLFQAAVLHQLLSVEAGDGLVELRVWLTIRGWELGRCRLRKMFVHVLLELGHCLLEVRDLLVQHPMRVA